jgi:Ca2+-transporting ATPase
MHSRRRIGYAVATESVIAEFGTDAERGLSAGEPAARLARFGPNELTSEPPPSVWKIALEQLRVPMNLMLVAVVIARWHRPAR